MRTRLYIAGLVMATTACLSLSEVGLAETPSAAQQPDNPALLDALSGEWALMQGDEKQALSFYLQALSESRDIKIAERTAALALNFGDAKAAYTAAKVWAQLAPTSGKAQELNMHLAFLLGDIANQTAAFNAFLKSDYEAKDESLAELYQGLSATERARLRNLTQTATSAMPHAEILWLAIAHFHFQDKNYDASLQADNAALALNKDFRAGIFFKSELLRLQKGEDASLNYIVGVANKSQDADVLMYAADLALKEKKLNVAAPLLEKLSHTDKRSAALLYLAQLSLDKKENEQAVSYLKQVKEDPLYADAAAYFLGRINEEQKSYAQAVSYYKQVQSGEYEITSHVFACDILVKQQKYEEAIAMLDAVNPKDLDELKVLSLRKADALFQAGNSQGAYDLLELTLRDIPNDVDLEYAQAVSAEQMGKYDIMESRFRDVIKQDPKHVDALNALGYNFANRKIHLDEALSLLKRAYDLDPNNPLVLDSLGWANYRAGNYKEAERYTQKALDIVYDAEIASHLGQILWAAGDYKSARDTVNSALSKNPHHALLQSLAKQYDRPAGADVKTAKEVHF